MADFVYTPEEAKALFARLSQPFAIADVKWRVTNKTTDGKKGCMAAYADPRAYTARLNEVFTPAGWAFELSSETTVGLTRMRAGKCVPTGKVTIIATLNIFGIGRKASTGEMWADDDNAVTRAEAQAKKRAASMFGLSSTSTGSKSLEACCGSCSMSVVMQRSYRICRDGRCLQERGQRATLLQ